MKKRFGIMDLGSMLEASRERFGSNITMIYEGKAYSYEDLDRAVNALANHFLASRIVKGDKVALLLPNCPEFVIAYFAAVKIGAVAVTLNVMSTSHELLHLLNDCEAKCLITEDILAGKYEAICDQLPLNPELITTKGPERTCLFWDLVKRGNPSLDRTEMDPDDPAVIIYTAGLTGEPLGAVLTHRNLLSQSTLVRDLYQSTERDRSLAVIPLFHSFGAAVNMLAALRVGAGIVLMDRFSVEAILKSIEQDKVTYIAAVPRLFLALAMSPDVGNYDTRSLSFCITGGSAMPPEYIPMFEQKFPVILREGYGLTEASPVCACHRRGEAHKPGSIGVAIPGAEIKIVDENGREVSRNSEGELIVRGDNVMKGYYGDEAATAQVIKNGWLHTGDLAKMDEDGFIFLTGRKKRMIITSGYNVYPREVERVLEMHPAVTKARVVAKQDLMRGEVVKALVVKDPDAGGDEKSIMRHCRSYLSSYKLPRELEFVEELAD
ncbi:MAG: long-chain fatty acid--CoA ligase [Deltaproteobacteria bacterium]|nr:long-chain fatty acid--CoA ligase [Deltaproteobacteria bacterium]